VLSFFQIVDFFLQESLHGRQWEIGGVPEEASQVKHFVTQTKRDSFPFLFRRTID
jgi:hypothetical protein